MGNLFQRLETAICKLLNSDTTVSWLNVTSPKLCWECSLICWAAWLHWSSLELHCTTHLMTQAGGMHLLLPGQQFLIQGILTQEQRSLPLNHVQTLPISAAHCITSRLNKENKARKMPDSVGFAQVWAVKAGAAKKQGAGLDPSSTRFFFKACWHFTTGHLWQSHSRSPGSSAETVHSRTQSLKSQQRQYPEEVSNHIHAAETLLQEISRHSEVALGNNYPGEELGQYTGISDDWNQQCTPV